MRRRATAYKKATKRIKNSHPIYDQLFIIFKLAIIKSDVTKTLPARLIYRLHHASKYFINEFNCEYASLTTIQPGVAIEFTIKKLNDLYLNLINSH